MTAQQIQSLLQSHFAGDTIDVTGEGAKFEVTICSDQFKGLMPVKRQQLVYSHLNTQIKSGEIHAVTMKLSTKS